MKSDFRTKARQAEGRRRYLDACGAAHGLDLVGDRWALLVVRELLFGPRRFSDLKRTLGGISATMLTARLDELEAAGIVARVQLPPPAGVPAYGLTAWGEELEPVIRELGRWAARSPGHDPALPLSAMSIMLSFRAMFRPERGGVVRVTACFRIGGETFQAVVADGRVETGRAGADAAADVWITAAPEAIAAWIYGGQALAELEEAGALAVAGKRAAAHAFARCFALPEKAAPPAPQPSFAITSSGMS